MTREQHDIARAVAHRMARRHRGRSGSAVALCDVEELVAAGMAALCEAPPYDEEHGSAHGSASSIETWAYPYLNRGIVAHLRQIDTLGKGARRQAAALTAAGDALAQRLGREPSDEELAAHADVPLHRVRLLTEWAQSRRPRSVEHLAEEGFLLASDQGAGESAQELLDAVDRSVQRAEIADSLARLDARSRRVVLEYFVGGRTLRGIAEGLGLTEARVSQIKSAALDELRRSLAVSLTPELRYA